MYLIIKLHNAQQQSSLVVCQCEMEMKSTLSYTLTQSSSNTFVASESCLYLKLNSNISFYFFQFEMEMKQALLCLNISNHVPIPTADLQTAFSFLLQVSWKVSSFCFSSQKKDNFNVWVLHYYLGRLYIWNMYITLNRLNTRKNMNLWKFI